MSLLLAPVFDPFNGVRPSLGPFQRVLNSPLTMILALLWAVAFFFVAYHLVIGIAGLANAHRRHRGDGVEAAKEALVWPIVALIGLAAVPAVWAALAGPS